MHCMRTKSQPPHRNNTKAPSGKGLSAKQTGGEGTAQDSFKNFF